MWFKIFSAVALASAMIAGHVGNGEAAVMGKASIADQTYEVVDGGRTPIRIDGTNSSATFTPSKSGKYLISVHLQCTVRGLKDSTGGLVDVGEGVGFQVTRQVGSGTPVTLGGTGAGRRFVGICNGLDGATDTAGCFADAADKSCSYVRESMALETTLQAGKTYTFKINAGAHYTRESGTPNDLMRFTVRNVVFTISN
jgi:hypothetical protein